MLKRKVRPYQKKCSYCGKSNHTAFNCYQKRKDNKTPQMRQESESHKHKRTITATYWFQDNPPDKDGHWLCYLQISPFCPRILNRDTITLEHVYPKAKYPELQFMPENLKPSCEFCNKLKWHNTIYKLVPFYPNLALLVATPEWQKWEDSMEVIANLKRIKLERPVPGQQAKADFRN